MIFWEEIVTNKSGGNCYMILREEMVTNRSGGNGYMIFWEEMVTNRSGGNVLEPLGCFFGWRGNNVF